MRAISLLCTLILAKICVVINQQIPWSFSAPIALLWQDCLVVLLFALLDLVVLRRHWTGWILFGLIVLYSAFNVPIARHLSTPLTLPMIQAAGAPLSDSILHYATWLNISLILLILLAAIAFSFLFRKTKPKHAWLLCLCLVPVIAIGPMASDKVATRGLHRNAWIALLKHLRPRLDSRPGNKDWTAGSEPLAVPREDLLKLQGSCQGRNVLLIILESAAAQYLKPYGSQEDPMPNITTMAKEGVLFENAYTTYPESIKGLFALICSTFPALDSKPEHYEDVPVPSIAAVLKKQNYQTALFHSGRFRYLGMESIIRNRGYDLLEDAGHVSGRHHSSFGVEETATVRRMLQWLDQRPNEKPFFMTYMPVAGHHPYVSPGRGPFPADTEIGRYRNALHYCDKSIGELMAGLKKRKLDQSTLVIVIGDHGQAFHQHPNNFGHVLFLYEENIRVPFLLWSPEAIPAKRVEKVVSQLDLAPTILDLLKMSAPESYQGRSLLRNEARTVLFFTDYSSALLGLRDKNWKYIYEVESDRSQLFDLGHDPKEKQNLAEQNPKRVKRYKQQVIQWSTAQRHNITNSK